MIVRNTDDTTYGVMPIDVKVATHPPLCHGTEELFDDENGPIVLVLDGRGVQFRHVHTSDRKVIARYQACAWQDRAKRYAALWRQGRWGERALPISQRCYENARAWREWEKAHD